MSFGYKAGVPVDADLLFRVTWASIATAARSAKGVRCGERRIERLVLVEQRKFAVVERRMFGVDRGDLVLQRFDFAHDDHRLQLRVVLGFLGVEFLAALL